MLNSASRFRRFNDGDFDRDDGFRRHRFNEIIVFDNFGFPFFPFYYPYYPYPYGYYSYPYFAGPRFGFGFGFGFRSPVIVNRPFVIGRPFVGSRPFGGFGRPRGGFGRAGGFVRGGRR